MGQDDVVGCQVRLRVGLVFVAWGHLAVAVAQHGRAPGLVERDPVLHAVSEALKADLGVVLEIVDDLRAEPSAVLLVEALWQIPVVDGHQRGDLVRDELVDQIVIKLHSFGVHLAPALREQPRPGDREPVGRQAQLLHQCHVLLPAMVMVARRGAVVIILHLSLHGAKGVPDARRPAVLVAALDLVGGRGTAPHEALRELQRELGARWFFVGAAGGGGGWPLRSRRPLQRGRRPLHRHGAGAEREGGRPRPRGPKLP
mmetsp:Transcript_39099/g.104817  ORF Transcript_39099/g.104817 Transcript_39099/m.104817 type:complete len:257 (+) Transcript_39099:1292-2062(+)